MKLILLENIKKIGKKDEIKEVPDGYAQNFLIPRKLAVLATPERIKKLELSKKQIEDEKGMHLEILRSNLEKIDNTEIVITRKVNSSGSLFAQIAEKDIQEEIKNASKILVPIEYIQLSEHIKHTGTHKIILGSKNKLGREYVLNLQIKGS